MVNKWALAMVFSIFLIFGVPMSSHLELQPPSQFSREFFTTDHLWNFQPLCEAWRELTSLSSSISWCWCFHSVTILAFRTPQQLIVLEKDQPLEGLILPSSYRVLNLHESSQRALVNQFPCPARGIDSLPRFWNQQCTLVPTSSTHCNCIGVLLKKCAFEAITPLACFDSYLKVILEHTSWILFEGTKDTL